MSNAKMLMLMEQAQTLERLIVENEGEITSEIEAAMHVLNRDRATQVDSFVWTRERLTMALEQVSGRIAQLQRIKEGFAKALEFQSEGLKMWMDSMNVDKLEGEDMTIYFKGGPGAVVVEDEALIPEEFTKVTRVVSRQAIRQAIAEGGAVPGAKLVKTKHLAFRTSGPKVATVKATYLNKGVRDESDSGDVGGDGGSGDSVG